MLRKNCGGRRHARFSIRSRRFQGPCFQDPAPRGLAPAMPDLHLLSPRGFRATGVYAGIKTKNAPDVGLLVCEGPVPAAAAVFTTNKVVAAPVVVGRRHLAQSNGRLRAVVVNAGNANACTGRQGEKDALRMCRLAAAAAGCDSGEVLPSSTGIIGHLMPMEKVERG